MGKPAIYKSHDPRGNHWGRDVLDKQLTNNPTVGGLSTSGIVRLARNPGDQLIRDLFRWDETKCHSHECFLEHGKEFCDQTIDYGSFWSDWHEFWIKQSLTTPQILYYYEHFSNKTHVTRATEKVLDFLNEQPPAEELYSMKDMLHDIVKDPPPYEQGKLMAKICGKEKAQALHEATKRISEQVGYVCDNDSATWLE